jgi:hypothetical protein
MQTVSREVAEKLKAKGFKNTEWWLEPRAYGTYSDPIRTRDPGPDWLPAPTIGELLESFPEGSQFEIDYVVKAYPGVEAIWAVCRLGVASATDANLADALAEVWIKVKGKEAE